MASYSVGFPAGSPPPVRAATSMFLISLANSLPRLASMPAFLCFVVAHLEWPLMKVLPRSRRRPARPGGRGRCPRTPHAPHRPRPARGASPGAAEDPGPVGALRDPGRPDEGRVHPPPGDPLQGETGLEGVHLPAE